MSARTIRPDGSIVNFDGKVFDKSIRRKKRVSFPSNSTDPFVTAILSKLCYPRGTR